MHKETDEFAINRLYRTGAKINVIDKIAEMQGGEISEDASRAREEFLKIMETDTDSVVDYVRYLEDQISLANSRINELEEFKTIRKNGIERIKDTAHKGLEMRGVNSFRGEIMEIRKNKPSKVLSIEDENAVPNEYVTVETNVKIDKMKLKSAIKNGLEVKGISLVDGARSISFKTKSLSKGRKK